MQAEHQLRNGFVARGRARAGATSSLARVVAALWSWMLSAHKRRQAIRELRAFDDRMLRDIGVTRSEIEHVVQYGRHWE
jgi:uncharacterized protein YjiS (DUF1127 family)